MRKNLLKSFFLVLALLLTTIGVRAEDVTFDFTANEWGHALPASTLSPGTDCELWEPLSKDDIDLVFKKAKGGTAPRYWTGPQIRIYKNNILKVMAPAGKAVTNVVFTANGTYFGLTAANGTLTEKTWEGNATYAKFTATKTNQLLTMVVTLADATTETTTPTETAEDVLLDFNDPTIHSEFNVTTTTYLTEELSVIDGHRDSNDKIDGENLVTTTIVPVPDATTNSSRNYLRYASGKVSLYLRKGGKLVFKTDADKVIQKITIPTTAFNATVNSAAVTASELSAGYTCNTREVEIEATDGCNIPSITFTVGDKQEAQPTDITIAPASGDIAAILDKASEGKTVRNITINLTAGASYTIKASLVVGGSVTINGNGATIDASSLTQPFIAMNSTPVIDAVESGQYVVTDPILIEGVTVKGLTKALFADNSKSYAYENFTINNSVFEFSTQSNVVLNMAASMAINFNITNSTFYSKAAGTANFIALSGKRPWQITGYENETGKLTVANCTFYNLAKAKQFLNTNVLKGQKYLYEFNSNIFVDISNKKIYGNMTNNNKQLTTDGKNTYYWGGSFFAETNYNGDEGLPTDPEFVDAANGDFTIGAGTAQAKEQTGDPRWLVAYDAAKAPVSDVTISPADGDDISVKVAEASQYFSGIKNLTINLAKDASYTVSAPLVAGGNITINGADGATIDASGLNGNMIQMAAVENPTDWTAADVTIKGVTVKGLKKALFYSTNKKYVAENFIIDNCVVEQAADATTIDYTKGSTAKNITVTNSTFYAPTATTKSFYSSQGGEKYTEYDSSAGAMQTFTFTNNTMYNLAPTKNFFSHRQNNQKWMTYDVKNNIFVNCGKSGQVIKGMNGGQGGANPTWVIDGNIFNFDGADTSANEETGDADEPVQNSYAGVVEFEDAANGIFNFNLTQEADATAPTSVGDPRWTMKRIGDFGNNVTAAIDVDVPANLGENGGATDLATFLDSYLETSPNPAYIKLTLKAGAQYTISKAIETITAIQIIGDENEPATIDASGLSGAFVQISDSQISGTPNDNGFYTNIYNVELKNFEIEGLSGSLFSANGQAYLIPNFTVENVLVQTTGGTVIDMDGSVVENLTVTKSTMNGAALAYKATTDAASAGVTAQTINASYNTFYQVIGLQIGAMLTAPQMSNRSMALTSNLSLDFNHNVVISDNFAFNGQAPSSMLVQYNSFVKADGTDNSAILTYVPGVGGTIEGDLVFAAPDEVANGNLGLGACPQKTAKIGDPRWLDAAMKITAASLDDDNDLAKAINEGVENGFTKFELEENARYQVKQSIVTDKNLVITGKNVKIDASENADAFILLSKTPAVDFLAKADGTGNTDYYGISNLTLRGLQITGLKNSIIYDNNTKYCVVDLTIDDCVLGLETEKVQNEALISFQAGGAKDVTVKNSTVYGNNEVAKYFVRYNNSARIDRFGFDKADDTWSFTYENNTFYGLLKSDGQWGNYSGIVGKNAQGIVTVKNNIWYDCDSQTMRRMLGSKKFSQFSSASQMENNTFIVDGEAVDQGDYGNGSDLTGDPGFKNAAEGDFTLSAYSAQCTEKTGDPRWFAEGGHYNPTAIEGVAAEKADDGAWYDLQGRKVANPTKGLYIHNGKKVVIK